MLSDGHDVEREEGSHYHIFEFKCGTTAMNYRQIEFEQVRKFIDLSERWNVFYRHDTGDFFKPIPKETFLPSK